MRVGLPRHRVVIAVTDYPTPSQYTGRNRPLRLVILHSTETPTNTARSVARNFQDDTRKTSAHWIVGTDATVSGVAETDTAWAAPGANADGIQIEQCGYAASTDWRNGDGLQVVQATAHLLAQVCARHSIPLRHLSDAELAAGASGVVSHAQVSAVYKKSTHTDPGPTYPWDLVLTQEDDMNTDQDRALSRCLQILEHADVTIHDQDRGPLAQAAARINGHTNEARRADGTPFLYACQGDIDAVLARLDSLAATVDSLAQAVNK